MSPRKCFLTYLPYLLMGLYATNFGEAWRMAVGEDASAKLLSLISVFPAALKSFWPSLHPFDLLVGLCCGAGLWLGCTLKGKAPGNTVMVWNMAPPDGAPTTISPPTWTRCSRITSF